MFSEDFINPKSKIFISVNVTIIFISSVSLVFWFFNMSEILGFGSKYIPIAPSTALNFLFLSISIIFLTYKSSGTKQKTALIFTFFCTIISSLTLVDEIFRTNSDFDNLITPVLKNILTPFAGHMSPYTAGVFVLCSISLICLKIEKIKIAGILGTIILCIGSMVTIGYMYSSPLLYGKTIIPVAFLTGIEFLLFGVSIISIVGSKGWPLKFFIGKSTRVRLFKIFYPTIFFTILFQNWFLIRMLEISDPKVIYLITITSILVFALVYIIVSRLSFSLGHSIDVANREQKIIKENLSRMLALLNETQSIAKVGGWDFQIETKRLSWTKEVYNIHEVDLKYKISLNQAIDFYTPDSKPKIEQAVQRCLEFGESFDLELEIITAKCNNRWVHAIGKANYLHDQISSISGTFQDITQRKQDEQELELGSNIVQNIQIGLHIYKLENIDDDKTLRMVFANPASAEFTGIPVKDVTGKTLDENFPLLRERGIPQKYAEVVRTKKPMIIEDIYYSDNRVTESAFYVKAFSLPDNQVGVSFENITERKKVEKALEDISTRWQTTFDAIDDFIILLKPDHEIIEVNKAVLKAFDKKREEVIGKKCFTIFHNSDSPIKDCPCELSLQEKRIVVTEYVDGDRTYELTAWPVFGENNNVEAFTHIVKDISERKQTEEMLKRSEERLRTMFDQSPFGIALIDSLTGRIYELNMKFSEITGRSKAEMLKIDWMSITHPDDVQKDLDNMALLNSGEISGFKMKKRYIRPDSSIVWINMSIAPLTVKDKSQPCHLCMIEDITEMIKAEQEHLRLQNLESLGVLAGGIAHDFNNILSVILGRASMALSYTDDGSIKNDLLAIEKASRRAIGLTQQLLTFAKGGAPEKCVIDIRKIIKDTTKFALSGSNVISKFNFKDSSTIDADPGQISQVIQNLVINANQAMPVGGTLDITTEQYFDENEKQYVKIIVKDSGGGISKENIDKIFDPYFTTKETGTGLGLSVCYSIIQRHDGQISIESEIGKGTTFTILLPSTKVVVQEKVESKNVVTKGLNVLIMDDQETIRELLTDLLFHLGHKVTATKEGGESIRKYNEAKDRKEQFDILFLDLTVPGGMGGKEAVKKLREIDPNVRVIVSSGYAESSISSYRADGFDGVLKKPYSKAELNQVIFEVINK